MSSEKLRKLQDCRDMLQKCIEQTEDAINKTELEFLQLISLVEGEKKVADVKLPPVELENATAINAKQLVLTNANIKAEQCDDEEFDSD